MNNRASIIGANIKRLRKDKGFSQKALAALIKERTGEKITDKSVSGWETGRYEPRTNKLKALEEILGIPDSEPEYFLAAPRSRISREISPESMQRVPSLDKIPYSPDDLANEDLLRWQRNWLILSKWIDSGRAFWVPQWALKKFCQEMVAAYKGGSWEDVEGILMDYQEEAGK